MAAAGRPGRPGRGGPRRPVLGVGLPARRPHAGQLQRSSCAGGCARRPAGRAAGGPAGQRGRSRRRPRRPWTTGSADLVEMTRAQIAEPRLVALVRDGAARPGAALHPLQPGLPGPGQPQSHRELRGRAPQRPRDRRARRRGDRRRRAGRSWWSGPGWPASSAPGCCPAAGTGCGWSSGPTGPAARSRAAAVGPGRQRLAELAEWLMAECRASGGRASRPGVGGDRRPTSTPPGPRGVEVVLATGSRPAPPAVPVGRDRARWSTP